MSVSNSFLVNVNVNINNTLLQGPNFNQCMLVAVMPLANVPESWGGQVSSVYSSALGFSTDFAPLLTAAVAAGDLLQANRYQWILTAVSTFFSQATAPLTLTVGAIPPPDILANYSYHLNQISLFNNNWYGFSICDLILADTYSTLTVQVTTAAGSGGTIPAGTALTGTPPIPAYYLPQSIYLAGGATYNLTFYSKDGATKVNPGQVTGISPALPFVTTVENAAQSSDSIPGILTTTTGLTAALSNFASAEQNNPKFCFLDSNDVTVARDVQLNGSDSLAIFYHSQNFQSYNVTLARLVANLAAANLGQYFGNIFTTVGSKPLSSMQISGVFADTTINTANIGKPGDAGSFSSLIGWNNNLYPAFGNSPGTNLMQYGFVSSSVADNLKYIDEIVGRDFIRITAQNDIFSFIVNQQATGGVLYNDFGIQQVVSVFKSAIQKAVNQNILQQPDNSNFSYYSLAQVKQYNPNDIANRLYKNLSFTGNFLSRIQQISVSINLSI